MKNRRRFIKDLAKAGVMFSIVPRNVLGRGFVPPSDQLNIAGVGVGGKGYSDVMNAFADGKNNITALCDVDLGFKPVKELIQKFPKAAVYQDFREMLAKSKDIDAVVVSSPDHTHAAIAMAAMELGKHVYVQKPLAHNIHEVRTLTEAARKYKIVSQMGNQGASCNEQVQLQKWIRDGLIGKINEVNVWTNRPVWPQGVPSPTETAAVPKDLDWNLWIGPAKMVPYHPTAYHAFKWRGWWNFGTGALGDMGCHLIDPPFKALGLGYPKAVQCSVGSVFMKDWVPEYFPESCPASSSIQLNFDATPLTGLPVKLTWMDGGIKPYFPEIIPPNTALDEKGGSENGFIIHGEKGIITGGLFGLNAKAFLNNGDIIKIDSTKNTNGLPEYGHQYLWAEACKTGFNSANHKALTSSFDYSGPMTETVLMGNLAIRSYIEKDDKGKFSGRQKLLWDGANTKITNYEAANAFVKRTYRAF